jgi:hypothetical protein
VAAVVGIPSDSLQKFLQNKNKRGPQRKTLAKLQAYYFENQESRT